MSLHHFGDAGAGAGIGVVEGPDALALIKGHAPAIFVRAGDTAPAGQAGETEAQIGGGIGAHRQQFTHGRRRS